ncbi:MAG: hypothetical protein AAFO01_05825 [Pseudomonadota bacterium]
MNLSSRCHLTLISTCGQYDFNEKCQDLRGKPRILSTSLIAATSGAFFETSSSLLGLQSPQGILMAKTFVFDRTDERRWQVLSEDSAFHHDRENIGGADPYH